MPSFCFMRNSISKDLKMLEKASEQPSRFAARDWVEVNDGSWQNYDTYLIEIKTSMLQSRLFLLHLCMYFCKREINGCWYWNSNVQLNEKDVQIAFKNFAPFTNCTSDVHDTQVDEAKNRKKLQSDSIRISDVEFGIGLEILGKIFLQKLFCV